MIFFKEFKYECGGYLLFVKYISVFLECLFIDELIIVLNLYLFLNFNINIVEGKK